MKEKKPSKKVKMTSDIVFKKFFTDKPEMLKLVLKHFLEIDTITDITITNPRIPELEEVKQDNKTERNNNREQKEDKHIEIQTVSQKEEHKQKIIEELIFLDSELPSENRNRKRVYLDLRVKLSSGENINVEMQSYYQEDFLKRVLYYWARLHSQNLKKGESYNEITPTYSLIFTELPFLDKKVKDFISSFSIRRDKEPYILFNKDLKIVIVELSKLKLNKLKKSNTDLLDFKELWCYFLRESDRLTRKDREYLSRHKELEEAMEHFDRLSKEEKLQELALDEWRNNMIHESIKAGWIKFGEKKGREKGIQTGIEKGIQTGIEKGIQTGIEKVVLNMLKAGSKVSFICKVTGLSEEKIKEVKNRLY